LVSMKLALPLLGVVCATALWGVSLSRVDLNRMGDLGLLTVLPLATYVAIGILTVSFCLAVHRHATPTPILLLHVLVLIVIIHGTPAILYGTPRYAWTWKHIGIVDYIQRHGSVNPDISFLNVYHNWPAFFAMSALFTEAAGFKSAVSFVQWAPPFFNLLDLGGLLLIFNALTDDRRLVWLSVWFFYSTNMIGQDYFSPQAMAYFLNLVVIGVCLTWFRVAASTRSLTPRWRRVFDRAARMFKQQARNASRSNAPENMLPPLQRAGLLTTVIALFAVIVSSHQLTPFLTIFSVAGLVIFKRCRLRNLPLLMVVMTMAWIVNMAVAFLNGNLSMIVQSIGRLDTNANATLVNVQKACLALQEILFAGRVLVAAVICLAVLGCLRRWQLGYRDLSCIILAIAPVPLVAANSYGGEIAFRVYFFSLPFMAFFVAALLYPSEARGLHWRSAVLTIVVCGGLLVGFFFPYYGKERMNYFSKDEVAAAQYLYDSAPAGSLFLSVDYDTPSDFKNYERYHYKSLLPDSGQLPPRQQQALLSTPATFVSGIMQDGAYSPVYLVITRAQKALSDENGYLPRGSLDTIERDLKHSSLFRIVLANPDATIFLLNKAR
jgi:hypothetical protein